MLLKEVYKWAPEVLVVENNGHSLDFAGLDEGQYLQTLVQCAVATREEDIDLGSEGKHHFAGEEVVEGHPLGEVRVYLLFHRELDVETYRLPTCLESAFGDGLHHA